MPSKLNLNTALTNKLLHTVSRTQFNTLLNRYLRDYLGFTIPLDRNSEKLRKAYEADFIAFIDIGLSWLRNPKDIPSTREEECLALFSYDSCEITQEYFPDDTQITCVLRFTIPGSNQITNARLDAEAHEELALYYTTEKRCEIRPRYILPYCLSVREVLREMKNG